MDEYCSYLLKFRMERGERDRERDTQSDKKVRELQREKDRLGKTGSRIYSWH